MKTKNNTVKAILYMTGIVFIFSYLFHKTDIIPDALPWFGFLDDAIVTIAILLLVRWLIKRLAEGKK